MKLFQRFLSEKTIFFFLILLGLTFIWSQHYFLTSDGPAHVYNAKMLLDILLHRNKEFYLQYYTLSTDFNPNWFSHILLMLLQYIFNPVTAEKILLSIYVVLMPLSFRLFLKQLNRVGSWASLLIFPFIFQFLFFYGFYNYCFCIAFAFLFLGCWLKFREKKVWLQLLILGPLSALTLLTHIFGWFIIALIASAFFVVEFLQWLKDRQLKVAMQKLWRGWGAFILSAALPILLSLFFIGHHIGQAQYFHETKARLWQVLSTMEMLVIYSDKEKIPAVAFGVILLLLFLIGIVYRVKSKASIIIADGLIFPLAISLTIYFLQPVSLSLAGFWVGRMALIPWMILAIWIGSFTIKRFISLAFGGIITIIFIAQLIFRFPYQEKLSEAETDYMSACSYILPNATILPLSFCHNGLSPDGKIITEKMWQFRHGFDYCGAMKPVINFANYEAASDWFPILWKPVGSPFQHIGKNLNIEGQPPEVRLNGFDNSACAFKVDYVVTWCREYRFVDTYQWAEINNQLNSNYEMIYKSNSGRTEVWKRKI